MINASAADRFAGSCGSVSMPEVVASCAVVRSACCISGCVGCDVGCVSCMAGAGLCSGPCICGVSLMRGVCGAFWARGVCGALLALLGVLDLALLREVGGTGP